MSNQNQENNQVKTENGTPATNGNASGQERQTLIQRIIRAKNKFQTTKVGKFVIGGAKLLGVGGGMYLSYKAGERHVKPTTIYIREGVPEEEPAETNETIDEETGEVTE